jgi:hypothetical protein
LATAMQVGSLLRTAQCHPSKPAFLGGLPDADRSTLSRLMRANLDVGIVVSNSRGKMTLVNAAAKRLARRVGKSLTVVPNIWVNYLMPPAGMSP